MGARFRSWWQQIKQYRVTILVVAIILVIVIALIIIGYRVDWTGFNGNTKSGKTLWDWLNLLGVLAIPVVVGFGAVWFTTRQGNVADAENKDNQRETALQAYIDKMSELLLEKKLRDSAEEDEVRKIARVRTLTVLPRLDANRKGNALQFLFESGLIFKDKPVISLRNADLSGANLSGTGLYNVNLSGANLAGANLAGAYFGSNNLSGANLEGANLSDASLSKTNLSGANLSRANLSRANLWGFSGGSPPDENAVLIDADLSNANLKEAYYDKDQLDVAKSLKGATMHDGSIHP
jgi:uncharacterized protein YjbI with pentapeptide repeats